MESDRRVVLPLQLNLGHRVIFTIKTSLVNEKISTNAKFAEVESIKIKRIENDEERNQIVVNNGIPNTLRFNYNDTGISVEETDAKRAAAVFNKNAREEVMKTIEIEKRKIEGLEKLLKFYDEELPNVNLI